MKSLYTLLAVSALAAAASPGAANAALVLDSGTPTDAGFPLLLNGNDYVAAEFALGAGQTITSIQAYITAGDSNPGDTFTVALYSGASAPDGHTLPVWSAQATYTADGWNGLSNLNISGLAAGNYWAAFEVGFGDSALDLSVPVGAPNVGSSSALAFAFTSGGGYATMTGENFGVQVSAVPLPGALLFFTSGLLGLGSFRRKSRIA
jgi:hypothetical protein